MAAMWEEWTLVLCKIFLLFQKTNMAAGDVSKHPLYWVGGYIGGQSEFPLFPNPNYSWIMNQNQIKS